MVLSGMSSLEQVKDNIQTFSDDKLLSEEEISLGAAGQRRDPRPLRGALHGLPLLLRRLPPTAGYSPSCLPPITNTGPGEKRTCPPGVWPAGRPAGGQAALCLYRLRRVYRPLSPGTGRARLYEGDGVVSVKLQNTMMFWTECNPQILHVNKYKKDTPSEKGRPSSGQNQNLSVVFRKTI